MTRKRVALILPLALAVAAIAGGAAAFATSGSEAPPSDPSPAAAAVDLAESAEPAALAVTDADDDRPDDVDGPDDVDVPITGPDLERASAAALEYLGEGRVTETEIDDEESYYEVEVTLADGRQIDVQLDEAFNVVGTD